MKNELELLQERIKKIEKYQSQCKHDWDIAEYDPEKKEKTIEEYVKVGTDSYYRESGTGIYEYINRWSRTCKICGKKEYTYELEEVPVKLERRPKF